MISYGEAIVDLQELCTIEGGDWTNSVVCVHKSHLRELVDAFGVGTPLDALDREIRVGDKLHLRGDNDSMVEVTRLELCPVYEDKLGNEQFILNPGLWRVVGR